MAAFLDFAQAVIAGEHWAKKVVAITSISLIGLIATAYAVIGIVRSSKVK